MAGVWYNGGKLIREASVDFVGVCSIACESLLMHLVPLAGIDTYFDFLGYIKMHLIPLTGIETRAFRSACCNVPGGSEPPLTGFET